MKIPSFGNKSDLFKFLIENKDKIKASKMATVKEADSCPFAAITDEGEITRKAAINTENLTELNVQAAINTTSILDSHGDVHIKGLWKKSLRENKMIMHLQEHKMEFEKIISDGRDLKVSVKDTTFKELGFKYEGQTQALIFDSTVKQSRNAYMFQQYADGNVINHSVGMRYVKLYLAVNDEKYKEEKAIWDKYFPEVVNKKDAEAAGYFWAVTEAKVIEGSAVPIGSNRATPTISVTEPGKSTPEPEPPKGTQTKTNVMLNFLN